MADYHDPSIEALRPAGPPTSGPPRRPPRILLVIGGLVLVIVVAFLLVQLVGGDDDTADGTVGTDATDTTLDAIAELTTPLHPAEEFVAALAAADPLRGGASPEETNCFATAVVAAVGGAEGLQSFSLTPDEFTDLALLRHLDVPANAADVFLDTALGCGFDPAEVVVFRYLGRSQFPEREQCIRARVDRNLANQALSEDLFDEGGGVGIPADLEHHLFEVSASCATG